jgi:hypothetical protein
MAPETTDLAAKSFAPPSGQANLYVYRNESIGGGVKMTVDLDGSSLGNTGPETFLYTPIPEGTHTIVSQAEDASAVTIDAKPGANYFLWQEVKFGLVSARTELHAVDEVTGRQGVRECKMALTYAPKLRDGCSKDTDCKGSRICKAHACVESAPAPLTN